MNYVSLGATDVKIPPIIFGTSCLGNLYRALPFEIKLDIVKEIFDNIEYPVLDTAGKYGAGLALEVIGKALRELSIAPNNVSISNKLGWQRIPLTAPEPTFEPGAWADLEFDAEQSISYDGILRCYEQGVELLGDEYAPQVLSVHDPDEYIAAAPDAAKEKVLDDILDAYRALYELKSQGRAKAIGGGAKDWRVIQQIDAEMELDWVMLAVSYTIFSHPLELLKFIDHLQNKGVTVINSAVFHSGFLTGGKYFDYRVLDENNPKDQLRFVWRKSFFNLCGKYNVLPATACVQFAMSHPGVASIALNTSNPKRIKQNIESVLTKVPPQFWAEMKEQNLIDENYPHMNILETGE